MYCGFNLNAYDGVCDVGFNFRTYFEMLVNKCCNLFVWENLPETVDRRFLDMTLILNGKVCWTEFEGKLYALNGSLGGEPNAYYEPTNFIIANPVLGSKQVKVRQKDGSESLEGLDGILMANSDIDAESDHQIGGLYGLIYQTAGLLADNISSLNVSQINSRVSLLFTADSQAEANTGEKVLQEIYSGKPYRILAQNIVEKFGVNPVAASGGNQTLMTLIEAHQYILAQFYQEIGISSNYNMKRERLNTAEVEMNNGCLDINIWNMLENRRKAVEKINEMFGTNISVSLNPQIYNEDNGNAAEEETNEILKTPTASDEKIEEEVQTDDITSEDDKSEEGEA